MQLKDLENKKVLQLCIWTHILQTPTTEGTGVTDGKNLWLHDVME